MDNLDRTYIKREEVCISTVCLPTVFGLKELRNILFEFWTLRFQARDLQNDVAYDIARAGQCYGYKFEELLLRIHGGYDPQLASKFYVNFKRCHFIGNILKEMDYDEFFPYEQLYQLDMEKVFANLEHIRESWNQEPRNGRIFIQPIDPTLGFNLTDVEATFLENQKKYQKNR